MISMIGHVPHFAAAKRITSSMGKFAALTMLFYGLWFGVDCLVCNENSGSYEQCLAWRGSVMLLSLLYFGLERAMIVDRGEDDAHLLTRVRWFFWLGCAQQVATCLVVLAVSKAANADGYGYYAGFAIALIAVGSIVHQQRTAPILVMLFSTVVGMAFILVKQLSIDPSTAEVASRSELRHPTWPPVTLVASCLFVVTGAALGVYIARETWLRLDPEERLDTRWSGATSRPRWMEKLSQPLPTMVQAIVVSLITALLTKVIVGK